MKSGFPDNLARLRRERNLSQRAAAEDLGVSQALLSHYEKGVREPRFEFVERACAYYGVSADYLLGLTDQRTSMDDVVSDMGSGDAVRTLFLAARDVFSTLSKEDPELCEMTAELISISLSSVIRMMYSPDGAHAPRYDAAQKLSEDALSERLRAGTGFAPPSEIMRAVEGAPDRVLNGLLGQAETEE